MARHRVGDHALHHRDEDEHKARAEGEGAEVVEATRVLDEGEVRVAGAVFDDEHGQDRAQAACDNIDISMRIQ